MAMVCGKSGGNPKPGDTPRHKGAGDSLSRNVDHGESFRPASEAVNTHDDVAEANYVDVNPVESCTRCGKRCKGNDSVMLDLSTSGTGDRHGPLAQVSLDAWPHIASSQETLCSADARMRDCGGTRRQHGGSL